MSNGKMSPPWYTYEHEIEALFGADPDINIVFDPEELKLSLYVDNTDKAEALEELLPKSVNFGNVEMSIAVIPANDMVVRNNARLFELAFKGNPVVTDIVNIDDVFSNPIEYVVFQKEVVQYYSDNIGDLYGNTNTLLQDVAKRIFDGKDEGIYFCTDSEEE